MARVLHMEVSQRFSSLYVFLVNVHPDLHPQNVVFVPSKGSYSDNPDLMEALDAPETEVVDSSHASSGNLPKYQVGCISLPSPVKDREGYNIKLTGFGKASMPGERPRSHSHFNVQAPAVITVCEEESMQADIWNLACTVRLHFSPYSLTLST